MSADDVIAPEPAGRYVHQHVAGSRLTRSRGRCPNLSAPTETVAAIQDFLGAGPAAR